MIWIKHKSYSNLIPSIRDWWKIDRRTVYISRRVVFSRHLDRIDSRRGENLDRCASRAFDYFEIHLRAVAGADKSADIPRSSILFFSLSLSIFRPVFSPAIFRVTGEIGMPARVAGLRIPDEKPSGSCTYPGCTCTRGRALSTCRAASSRLRDANELARRYTRNTFRGANRGAFLPP